MHLGLYLIANEQASANLNAHCNCKRGCYNCGSAFSEILTPALHNQNISINSTTIEMSEIYGIKIQSDDDKIGVDIHARKCQKTATK